MTRHLQECPDRGSAASPGVTLAYDPSGGNLFHLIIEGAYAPEYWLHIEVPASATFEDLDQFLRAAWLECCGHLSHFQVGEETYASDVSEGGAKVFGMRTGEHSMRSRLGHVLKHGLSFKYAYDFGSTTELKLEVVAERPQRAVDEGVVVLARNEPPRYECMGCEEPATQICTECACQGTGWLCDACSADHECGEEMLLPAANSPRVGVCAYTGEAA